MAGMVLVVANGEWPSDELVQTLLNNAEFTMLWMVQQTDLKDGM